MRRWGEVVVGNIREVLSHTYNLGFWVVVIVRGFGVVDIVQSFEVVDKVVGRGIVSNIANLEVFEPLGISPCESSLVSKLTNEYG